MSPRTYKLSPVSLPAEPFLSPVWGCPPSPCPVFPAPALFRTSLVPAPAPASLASAKALPHLAGRGWNRWSCLRCCLAHSGMGKTWASFAAKNGMKWSRPATYRVSQNFKCQWLEIRKSKFKFLTLLLFSCVSCHWRYQLVKRCFALYETQLYLLKPT